jgi:hypothetical protein
MIVSGGSLDEATALVRYAVGILISQGSNAVCDAQGERIGNSEWPLYTCLDLSDPEPSRVAVFIMDFIAVQDE